MQSVVQTPVLLHVWYMGQSVGWLQATQRPPGAHTGVGLMHMVQLVPPFPQALFAVPG